MSRSTVHVLDQAVRLRLASRAFVAEELLESLDADSEVALGDARVAEIRRRADPIDLHEVALIPAEKAFQEAFEALR
jgi:hypothetical protein